MQILEGVHVRERGRRFSGAQPQGCQTAEAAPRMK
jgi:hypothetical protein